MKKLILAVVVLLLCAPVQASDIATWVWGSDDAINARIGTFLTENNEVGGSFKWRDNDSEPRQIGIYVAHHFPDIVKFQPPIVTDFLPETINGTGYLGLKFIRDLDTHINKTTPIAGIVFEDILFLEYSLDGMTSLGIRIRF